LSQVHNIDESIRDLRARFEEAKNDITVRFGVLAFTPPTQPMPLYLPQELPEAHHELANLLNLCAGWLAFAEAQLAIADVGRTTEETVLTRIRAFVRVQIRKTWKDKKPTVQDLNDQVQVDPRVAHAEDAYVYWDTYYRTVRAMRDSMQKNWETVSRRITLLGQSSDRDVRGVNVNYHGVPMNARALGARVQLPPPMGHHALPPGPRFG
jgi:hypothetical protein